MSIKISYDDELFSKSIKQQIKDNSVLCRLLHKNIHETFTKREHSEKNLLLWKEACQIFHEQKDELIFPKGTRHIYLDPQYWNFETAETALCFLEIRPYHFNSGYICTYLLRHIKRAYLTEKQKVRFAIVKERQLKWKELKASRKNN